jgi:hypothetical protein
MGSGSRGKGVTRRGTTAAGTGNLKDGAETHTAAIGTVIDNASLSGSASLPLPVAKSGTLRVSLLRLYVCRLEDLKLEAPSLTLSITLYY